MKKKLYNDNIINLIFDKLGVTPNERFKIKNYNGSYFVTENLKLMHVDDNNIINESYIWLSDLLTDKLEIEHDINIDFTPDELLVLKYAYKLGYKYIAKDETNHVFMYVEKPFRGNITWFTIDGKYREIFIEMPHILWDNEPIEISKYIENITIINQKVKTKDEIVNIVNNILKNNINSIISLHTAVNVTDELIKRLNIPCEK